MKEDFLHYLWQYQLFNTANLKTTKEVVLSVKKVGQHNTNSGPDFLEAQVIIGGQLWAGNVEIHLKSSDWYVHAHEQNKAYDNVILHVVWEDDIRIFRSNNTAICTLELKGLVPLQIKNNYNALFSRNRSWIACANQLDEINAFTWSNWLERLYIERLEEKSIYIEKLLKESNNNWEAVLFQLLAKNFGLKVNGESFADMAKAIPFSVLRKESVKHENLETLLLGQAGLLTKNTEDNHYKEQLEKYTYQVHKYRLSSAINTVQFFRLRPPNFPTIRLSQLAHLYHLHQNLFQKLMLGVDVTYFYDILQTQASAYWDTHYSFGKESNKHTKRTTKSFIDLLLINTVIPLQFAYQRYIGKVDVEKLLQLIQEINPEKNSIISNFSRLEVKAKNAMDTQALLQLKKKYCEPQQCLKCKVGLILLKKEV